MNDWKIFAAGSAFFAGLTAIFAKVGVRDIPSNSATFIRTIVILLLTGAVVIARGELSRLGAHDVKSVSFLILSGITTGLSWLCYYHALQIGPASLVAPVDKLSLAFVVILAAVFLKEQLNVFQWTGVLLMTAGACLTALK